MKYTVGILQEYPPGGPYPCSAPPRFLGPPERAPDAPLPGQNVDVNNSAGLSQSNTDCTPPPLSETSSPPPDLDQVEVTKTVMKTVCVLRVRPSEETPEKLL